jgi:hypothetical protein
LCGHRFQCQRRTKKLAQKIWQLYTHNKQTYREIAQRFGKSKRWAQKIVDQRPPYYHHTPSCRTPLLIDAVFFGKQFGLLVFRSPTLKKNLSWYDIQTERVENYCVGVGELIGAEFEITGIVVDGKPGVLQALARMGFPVQMCHFHQIQIVSRYTTRHPRLPAAQELLKLARLLPETDQASFEYWLAGWHAKWQNFLNEKTFDLEKNRFRFTHVRLRKAYRSLVRHLPYLYTYQDHPDLPNTNNSLEGVFSQLKAKVNIHRGLKLERKSDLIDELLR